MNEPYRCMWIGQRVSDCFGFRRPLNICAAISCDYGQSGAFAEETLGLSVLSLEKQSRRRRNWSSGHINDGVRRLFHKRQDWFARLPDALCIVPYANTESIMSLSHGKPEWTVAGPLPLLREQFENKLLVARLFRDLQLPTVPQNALPIEYLAKNNIILPFPFPIVIKQPQSNSGSGIFLARSPEEVSPIVRQLPGNGCVAVEPYIESYSLNINAVSSIHGTICGPISVQLIGQPLCA